MQSAVILARVAVLIGRFSGGCFLVIGAHAGESADWDDWPRKGALGDVVEGEWKGGNDCRRVAGDGVRGFESEILRFGSLPAV